MPLGINGKVPAPGYRDAGNYGQLGNLVYSGNDGYSWSAFVNDINALHLYFNMTAINCSIASHRAHGLQLRCLSE
ncbi:hypothetical protein [uncultured Rikenella sp.]|uniref:hypothetical protein n=1 Tax=uncultured Rikenella sp. TaxID=368003 RepID=UPI0025DDEDBC|nr:hypothetical protein [uncultured Rikenella sp.]